MAENVHRMQTRASAAAAAAVAACRTSSSKRVAANACDRDCAAVPPPAKKRRALGNLSNNAIVLHVEKDTQMQKKAVLKPRIQKSNTTGSSSALCDENAAPNRIRSARARTEEKRPLKDITGFSLQSLCQKTAATAKGFHLCPRQTAVVREIDLPKDVDDIDSSSEDPQMCSIYVTDIYHHLRMAELKKKHTSNYMEVVQRDINPSMRGILVDWLVEVAEEYKLVSDTLYLTVAYIDRYLSYNEVNRQRLQLLGVACMLIASKYEEICAPQVEDFCYITDNTYTKEHLLEMERNVLKHLRFELSTPTTKTFLRRFIRAAQSNYKTPSLQLEFLGNYLAELAMVEYEFLEYSPSLIAASAVFLSKLTIEPTSRPWTRTLRHYSGYKVGQLEKCVRKMHELQLNSKNCTLNGVRDKYKQLKFKSVATLKPPTLVYYQFEDDDDVDDGDDVDDDDDDDDREEEQ